MGTIGYGITAMPSWSNRATGFRGIFSSFGVSIVNALLFLLCPKAMFKEFL